MNNSRGDTTYALGWVAVGACFMMLIYCVHLSNEQVLDLTYENTQLMHELKESRAITRSCK